MDLIYPNRKRVYALKWRGEKLIPKVRQIFELRTESILARYSDKHYANVLSRRAFLALCKSFGISDSEYARYMKVNRSALTYHKQVISDALDERYNFDVSLRNLILKSLNNKQWKSLTSLTSGS